MHSHGEWVASQMHSHGERVASQMHSHGERVASVIILCASATCHL